MKTRPLNEPLSGLLASPEQPKQQRQNRTDDETGHEGEVKTEIPFAVMNITRQPPQPAASDSRPKQQSHSGNEEPNNEQDFADIIHQSRFTHGLVRRDRFQFLKPLFHKHRPLNFRQSGI